MLIEVGTNDFLWRYSYTLGFCSVYLRVGADRVKDMARAIWDFDTDLCTTCPKLNVHKYIFMHKSFFPKRENQTKKGPKDHVEINREYPQRQQHDAPSVNKQLCCHSVSNISNRTPPSSLKQHTFSCFTPPSFSLQNGRHFHTLGLDVWLAVFSNSEFQAGCWICMKILTVCVKTSRPPSATFWLWWFHLPSRMLARPSHCSLPIEFHTLCRLWLSSSMSSACYSGWIRTIAS